MDMSFSEQSVGNHADDILQRHESEIRLLYQTKNINEVKRMMDAKPGFPKMALEDPSLKKGDKRLKKTKRRTEVIFGDRKFTWDQAWKNMKRAVDMVEPQLDPPSPLPAGITVRTPPPILLSPSPRMSFDTLRRDDSTTTTQSQGPFLRSESGIFRNGHAFLSGGEIIQQSHLLEPSPNNPLASKSKALSDCLKAQMLLHLPGLPIWNFSNALVGMVDSELYSRESACDTWYGATVSSTPHTISSVESTIFSGLGVANESAFHLSDLFSSLTIREPSAALATFGTRDRAYITMSMAIYLLSNDFVRPSRFDLRGHRKLFEALDSVFTEIPARHLRALLESHLASVRAAFEALLKISGILGQHFAFKTLIEIGTGNNWLSISARGHEYLYHAVCMDLDEVVQQLLEMGCRPDTVLKCEHSYNNTTAIVEALERRNIRCAQLLLKHCDVNSRFCAEPYHFDTNFTFFIQECCPPDDSDYDNIDETVFGQGFKLFLDAGADISSTFSRDTDIDSEDAKMWSWWKQNQIWSVLDCLFCFRPRLFHELAPNWGPAQASQPTRAGILMSLEVGRNALNQYCDTLAQNVGRARLCKYLELLVAEQLTGIGPRICGPRSETDLAKVCALVNFGVSMDKVLSRAPHLLANYMDSREEKDCDLKVIQYLLDKRAIVDEFALQKALEWQNNGLLALLIQNTTDIQQRSASSVLQAATDNNLEAVKMFLDAGVDVNTESPRGVFTFIPEESRHEPSSLLCQVLESWRKPFEDLRNMIEYLVLRGAYFRRSAMKPRLSDLVQCMLQSRRREHYYTKGLLRPIVQYIIDLGCNLSDPEVPSARFLEACASLGNSDGDLEWMEIFEFMFTNGALLRPGAPLAAWVGMGGGAELANEMLRGGVDIDAYCHGRYHTRTALQAAAGRCMEELVALLLQNGADANAPARGFSGMTALQAICGYNPRSPAERAQQIRIINLLLAYGADTNAPARVDLGMTALQAICRDTLRSPAERAQQISIINILLAHGADANAHAGGDSGVTALQAICRYDLQSPAAKAQQISSINLLLAYGADANAPARGDSGVTALQAICRYDPQSPAAKAQQISTINLLLAYGADINAAPANPGGRTALQLVAERGDLEVTMLLLSCDPPADVNMSPCRVLDSAAENGRIDVVKLLLNNHALSGRPGDTGYDGAIEGAEKRGFLAVADLICEHATEVLGSTITRSNITRTILPQPHRDWQEYDYGDEFDGYTNYDSDDEDSESAESIVEFLPVAQVQILPEAFEHPGPEHTAPEPGWVWDMEADNFLDFDMGFGNLADDLGSIYGLDYAP